MMCIRVQVGLLALLIAGLTITLLIEHQTQAKLRAEVTSLRGQLAQLQAENQTLSNRVVKSTQQLRLPAPPVPVLVLTPTPADALECTNLFARFWGVQGRES